MKYVAPQTKSSEVELEQGFMAGSANIENPNNVDNGRIEEHKINSDFNFEFENQDWDEIVKP